MKVVIDDDVDLVKKLQDGNEAVLKAIYQNNETAFINWISHHYLIDQGQAKEIFQLAVIALYRNARDKKLLQLTCSIRTYLFAVGKRLLLKQKRQEVRKEISSTENVEALEVPEEIYANLVDAKKLGYILNQVGDPCKSILEKFYFHNLSMEEIARDTGYKTEAVVRKKKHQCMEKMKDIVKAGNFTINDFME
jgi:RNA polymerase sigma factor (sigma-70 family)